MAEFVINVQDIEGSGKDYSFAIAPAWAAKALAGSELKMDASVPASLQLHASKSGEDVILHGRMKGQLIAECSRCLGDAMLPVDTEITSLFQARGADFRPAPDEDELTPEDLDRDFYTGDRVVLDDAVREYLLLELPMQPLCKTDCEGIPVPEHVKPPKDFGKKEAGAVDPRFAALEKMKLPTKE